MTSSTQWSSKDMGPSHCPIYDKSRPMKNGWEWRSAKAEGEQGGNYVLVAMCKPAYGQWQATLIKFTQDGPTVVGRLEDHASHKGLHVHAHCERGGVETGPGGMDGLVRVPPAGAPHRRVSTEWTTATFWARARAFFRIVDDVEPDGQLSLFSPQP